MVIVIHSEIGSVHFFFVVVLFSCQPCATQRSGLFSRLYNFPSPLPFLPAFYASFYEKRAPELVESSSKVRDGRWSAFLFTQWVFDGPPFCLRRPGLILPPQGWSFPRWFIDFSALLASYIITLTSRFFAGIEIFIGRLSAEAQRHLDSSRFNRIREAFEGYAKFHFIYLQINSRREALGGWAFQARDSFDWW